LGESFSLLKGGESATWLTVPADVVGRVEQVKKEQDKSTAFVVGCEDRARFFA
jgi:hypothetical protein